MVDVKITVDDFKTVCRTCLRECRDKISLYSLLVHEKVVADILSDCVSIKISKDNRLPEQMCQQCVTDLTSSYSFIDACRKSEQTLLNILKQNQDELEIKTETPSNVEIKESDQSDEDPLETLCEQTLFEDINTKSSTTKIEKEREKTETRASTIKPKKCPKKRHCTHCDLTFTTLAEYQEHCKKVKHPRTLNFSCPYCEKRFRNRQLLNDHVRTHTKEKPFVCELCSASFGKRSSLRRHHMTHSGERPHVCHLCGKGFIQKTTLDTHVRSHTGESPFICSVCGKGFKVMNALKTHSIIHEGVSKDGKETLRFECSLCQRTFATPATLKAHAKAHKEPRLLCSECGLRFRSNLSLQVHQRLHTNEKPYKCNVCHKTFRQSTSLRLHFHVHTGDKPYSCSECGKRYKRPDHVKMHVKTHHGREKPHKCGFCEKRFGVKWSLVVHERSHTGERPYACQVCGKEFSDITGRRRHMKVHLQEEQGVKKEEKVN